MFDPRYLYCGIESVAEAMPAIADANLGIEVVFDDTTDLWPDIRWENLLEVADLIHEAGIDASVHGPFHGVNLGSRDPNQREISRQMLSSALEFANAVHSPHLVIHTGLVPQYSPKARTKWLDQFCLNLEPLLDRAASLGVRIAVENTYEPDPAIFAEIFGRVQNPALGMCLDTGHATCFGQVEPAEWAKRFADVISHIHCSDNDGKDDLHWCPGKGVVNFAEILRPLKLIGALPSITFEVALEDAAGARNYLDELLKTL